MSEHSSIFLELNCQSNEAPEWIELIPAGNIIQGVDGRSFVNHNPENLVTQFNAANRHIPLDYDHGTEQLSKVSTARAAGWINQLKTEGGAVLGRVEWTPAGGKMVKDKEYRYISPALNCSGADKKIMGISSAALTNKPNLDLAALNHQQKEQPPMTKAIAETLGLNAEASEQAILTEISKLQTELNSQQAPDPNQYMPKADYDAVLKRAEAAEESLKEINENQLMLEANSVIDQAAKDGKITPASKQHYLQLCTSQEGLNNVKKALSISPKVAATEGNAEFDEKSERNNQGLTTDQVELCAQLDIPEEDFKKELS